MQLSPYTVVTSTQGGMLGQPHCCDKARAVGIIPVRGSAMRLSPLYCSHQHPGGDAGTAALLFQSTNSGHHTSEGISHTAESPTL
jgi:hypothetical protein